MPEQRGAALCETGRATAPPSGYTSAAVTTSEGYDHLVAFPSAPANSADQNHTAAAQSHLYTPNHTNYLHQRPQVSPYNTPDYSPSSSPSVNYPSTISKTTSPIIPFQSPQHTPSYSTSSHDNTYSPSFSSSSNFSTFTSSNNINNNINFEFQTGSKNCTKNQQSSYFNPENLAFSSSDQSSTLFNYQKISKANPNYSNFSYFSNNQSRYSENAETIDLCSEKNVKSKKDCELSQLPQKAVKDDSETNYNVDEWQQFLSKHGSKIKSTQEVTQDLVTDSLLHFLQRKTQERNHQDTFSYDLGDISQILVSLTSKYKSEDGSGLRKKDSSEDSKLMNDFFTKIILEKEDKRFKSFDDKRKLVRKEVFEDLNAELDEKKIKRDAMSHYQGDKSHHKRPSNYGEFNQWDYINQQEIQPPNNHNRRAHFSFGGTSQSHSMGWNPMGMGMPRQANPYYSNPHGHVMPAHAHAEYRYNQWATPNHKNVPNIQNAHSQSGILPQAKHHGDASNSIQDFGLPPAEKSNRTGIHSDHLATISPAMRNTSALRTPPLATHPKTVINNPLSDLQMLVTSQENDNPPQKFDNYQQESVDLSAHSEVSKMKENSAREGAKANDSSKDSKDFRSPISVIQIQNKQTKSEISECEKPVELTSKSTEKSAEPEISSSISVNNLGKKLIISESAEKNVKENNEKDVKGSEESVKTSVIVEKHGDTTVSSEKIEEGIPKNVNTNSMEAGKKEEEKEEVEEIAVKEDLTEVNDSQAANKDSTELAKTEESKEPEKNSSETEGNEQSKENTDSLKNGKRKATDEEEENERKKKFLEVESQLEKMFEGVTEEASDLPTVSSTSTEVKSMASGTSKKTPSKKPSRKSRAVRLSSGQSSSSESHLASRKFKSIMNESRKKMKKGLSDVADRRGPILHVEGSRESPSSVTVINFPKADDEDEKDKSFAKKQILNAIRPKHHNELDYRGRSRNGLFSSTLSARYDAHTTDHTWVCVFCKKGPHYNTLGDLFGPYIISKDENTSLCDFSGDEKDISDAQKRGGRNKKSLRSNNMVEHFQKMSRKLRRAQSGESCLTGMTVISDDQVDQLRYEVWVHEQCAVWSPNVCLIGSRIMGMQEAIWYSVKTMCSKCGAFGANIGCVYRNCPNRSHYHCAKESGWSLVQETFISTCQIHKPRS